MIDIGLLLTSFISIFSIVNPFTAMPIFLALTQNESSYDRNRQAMKTCIFIVMILTAFLYAGTYIINFYGISLEGIRIAGGLMIMQWGFSLLNPDSGGKKMTNEDVNYAKTKADISFSPMAMPLLSGPGSIAAVLGLGSQATEFDHYSSISISIVLVAIACYLVLRISPYLVKVLGQTGMTAMTRMMGFIALCIGVQFIINGVMPLL